MVNKIKLEIDKESESYSVTNREESNIAFFEDDDAGRKQLIQYLVDELLNKEVKNGRTYKAN